ncbi:MAG: ATP synthase F1 subunit delta [Phycisphaeraceae bacterium]|nr:ATP synthase F1 subunit delta [Phycisphaerae bacterium]MCP3858136.1 ATP synthase F1 subunit delta [Phycisphaeraceae bacterium]HAC08575.1 ATP synthase F1 subunit delta [Phycisphaerales bacterium]MCP4013167.1 ATP synthase F1 subunit delta [Phycisphaeraceae bacterium]MCP4068777.1 ATP synthase F1 subunit delta [Phycisphaeraceae bacterium]
MTTTSETVDAVARVYAQSLLELADAAGGDDKIVETGGELSVIAEMIREDAEVAEFLRSPIVDSDKRAEALRRIFEGRVSDLVLRFMLVLNGKGRLGEFGAMTSAYDQLVNERMGRVEVDVMTIDGSLGADQLALLAEKVKAKLGQEPVFHQYADDSLIGGIVLRVGDQLIDGSVRGQLRRMREELLASGSTRVRAGADDFLAD